LSPDTGNKEVKPIKGSKGTEGSGREGLRVRSQRYKFADIDPFENTENVA